MSSKASVKNNVKYKKFVLTNFGHANFVGFLGLVKMLEVYDETVLYRANLQKVADALDKNVAAVERGIRLYLEFISMEHSKEELSNLLEYPFKDKLEAAEFIPVLKFYIDNILD